MSEQGWWRSPPPSPRPLPWALVAVIVVMTAVANVVNNLVLGGSTYIAFNLLVAAGSVLLARRAGLTWQQLGLDRSNLRRGLRAGALVAAVVAAGFALVAALPPVREQFVDQGTDLTGSGVAFEALIRIPLGTALPEELLFRSVLLGTLLASVAPSSAVAWSSLLFGLWHVLPTLNEASAVSGGAATAAGAVVATTLAGIVFAWLRIRTGHVLAAVLAHAAINGSALLAAYAIATTG